jgi:ectoine hydroxylase-related dioxygenase (phytanoyl-CoA dioxygenase family)
MDLQRNLYEIEELGFAIVPDVVDKDECERLKHQLKIAIEEDWREFKDLPGKEKNLVVDLVARGTAFVKLLENEKMHEVFSHFLSGTCVLYSFTSTILEPNEKPAASAIHVDSPRLIPGYHAGVVMTLALDDFTEENGATYYLPGSQRSDVVPAEDYFYKNAVRVSRKAGDAVFFNPRVFHAGGINRTDATRHAVTLYACRSFMRQRFDYPRMVGPEILSQLGERGRAFLGFDVRVPTNQRQFYVPSEERLYKPNQG